jgi:RHS repeat-associated protein
VDANGNVVARDQDAFSYDQANRLVSATVGGTTTTYSYDGDGKRATKAVGTGSPITYTYDINQSLPMLLSDGTRNYVYGLGLAFSVDTSGNLAVYHTDGLGSVRALTDPNGNLVQTYQADEFGVPALVQGTSAQPFGYAGQQTDAESGFQYLRARMYDPSTGRFLQRDPVPGSPDQPQTINPYAYAGNNPTTFADPSGETLCRACTWVWAAVTLAAVGWNAVSADRTWNDPQASLKEKLLSAGLVIAALNPEGGAASGVEDVGAAASGSLTIIGEGFSESEVSVAQYLAGQGRNVLLRAATGVGRTSDLIVDGVPYDVYTPEVGTSVRNVLSKAARKWTQVDGGGVVIDLRNTGYTAADFGNALGRVNGFIRSWGGKAISDIIFHEG